MGAAHVKRGGGARTKGRKAPARVAVPKKLARKLSVEQAEANRLATWAFGLFVVAIAIVSGPGRPAAHNASWNWRKWPAFDAASDSRAAATLSGPRIGSSR